MKTESPNTPAEALDPNATDVDATRNDRYRRDSRGHTQPGRDDKGCGARGMVALLSVWGQAAPINNQSTAEKKS